MFILGIHGGRKRDGDDDPHGHLFHDAAAALIEDGRIIAAIEEERLDRIKHSNCFPVRAIACCLEAAGLSLRDVDRIAINMVRHVADGIEKAAYLDDARSRTKPDGAERLAHLFESAFGVDVRDKLRFCHHHLAHAWSAFAPTPFERSLILSIDGDGDNCSGMVLTGEHARITKLREFAIAQSLGGFYRTLIKMVGYRRFDEYKVMGLAPYGDPSRYASLLAGCYRLLSNGDYALDDTASWFATFEAAGLLQQARRKGEPFTQVHKDFSAALQQTLERIVFHVLRHYAGVTRQKHLCLVGGVAHNCTLNGKIASSGLFEQVYAQPAAHDAGGALGAAWWTYFTEHPRPARPTMPHVFWGTPIGGDDEIAQALAAWDGFVTVERVDDPAIVGARLLADGAVLGWAQGRSEFGPRALGNRSIVADPRPADNKRRINLMVKKREAYRPFAPSVLEERVAEYFDVPPGQTSFPFMIFVFDVRPHARALLGAVTHVDGTARIQTVSRESNPLYWRLIHEFDRLTGMPIVLNTSFNNNAEPIVDGVDDAVACYVTTGLDHLIVGSYLVTRRDAVARRQALHRSIVDLPCSRRLVKKKASRGVRESETRYRIESTKSEDFGTAAVSISSTMFAALQHADTGASFAALLEAAGVTASDQIGALTDELDALWAARMLVVRPRRRITPTPGACATDASTVGMV